MAQFIDSVPLSGIIRIRDMMYSVKDPFRLDQGDVSFDAPDTVKDAMRRAIDENRSHYVQTTGVPRLLELLAESSGTTNGIPIGTPDEVLVTTGGIHALYILCHGLLEPGDEVIVPDPEWPPAMGNIKLAHGVVVPCPLHERLGWRFDLDELESKITAKTKAIYINSPHNPTGGVLTRADIERIAAIADARGVWIISDEAYEDVRFDDAEHVSPASLPGMYDRTLSFYTFSKTVRDDGLAAGLRRGQRSGAPRSNEEGALLHGEQHLVDRAVRRHRSARRIAGVHRGLSDRAPGAPGSLLRRHQAACRPDLSAGRRREARSTRSCESSPRGGRAAPRQAIRCRGRWRRNSSHAAASAACPGADFGANGEGYIRFCFARDRRELTGALESLSRLVSGLEGSEFAEEMECPASAGPTQVRLKADTIYDFFTSSEP